MAHILHIDASARGAASHSRLLSGEFVRAWLEAHPGDTVTTRDIGHQAIPFVSEEHIQAMYTSPADRTPEQNEVLRLSDDMVDELLAADLYVLGVPMYNFSVPAVFKAWVDQVARIGRTFAYGEGGPKGLLEDKRAVVFTARGGGGYGPGEARAAYNYEDGFIETAFKFLGVSGVTFVHLNNLNAADEIKASSLAAARERVSQIVGASHA